MRKIRNNKRINSGLLLIALAISSCSNEHNQEISDNINREFELTYLYVVENLPIKDDSQRAKMGGSLFIYF